MNFGDALNMLKAGHYLYRQGWNGKGMFIYLEAAHATRREKFNSFFVMFTATKEYQPGWNASTPDLLAEDWDVLTTEEMQKTIKEKKSARRSH